MTQSMFFLANFGFYQMDLFVHGLPHWRQKFGNLGGAEGSPRAIEV